MMRMSNIRMTTTVDLDKLLVTLRGNLERHSKIVQEARDGYIEQAKEAVGRKLEELRQGKVVALAFSLSPPQDYSEVYRTTIKMLEWSTDRNVELQADEFRQLVEDQWDWSDSFIHSNAGYSATARKLSGG